MLFGVAPLLQHGDLRDLPHSRLGFWFCLWFRPIRADPFMGNGAQGSFSVIPLTPESCPLTLYCPRSLSLTQVPAGPGFPCALFPPLLFLTLIHSCGLVLYGAHMHYLLTLSAVSSHPNFSTVYCWCTDYYIYIYIYIC